MRRLAATFAATLAAMLVAVNFLVDHWRVQEREPPEYGTWSGVLELERKMRLLGEFARGGEVDALILGSSMGDQGISAEVLTREMSAHLGRPFRVFNFSIGGSELTTFSMLYRMARVIARPREVWIVTPVTAPLVEIDKGSLDDKFANGPLSGVMRSPYLLWLSYHLHQLPLVRRAPALRDMALNLRFANRPVTNIDLYDIGPCGDTLSWLYNVTQYESNARMFVNRRKHILGFLEMPESAAGDDRHKIYFAPRTLRALEDMRMLAQRDGVRIRIVPFDIAVGFGWRDEEYLHASYRFFEPLSRLLGKAPVVDVRASFELHPYMIADSIHMNSIGARLFSTLLAARMAGAADPPMPTFKVDDRIRLRAPDATWTSFTGIITKRAGEPAAALRLRYLQNWGLRSLTTSSNVRVAVRTSSGRDTALPARVVAAGEVIADTSSLPLAGGDEIITTQLLISSGKMGAGAVLPLAGFEWLRERPDVDFNEIRSSARVSATERVFSVVSPVSVAWAEIREPSPKDWIGVIPVGADAMERVTFAYTDGTSQGTMQFKAALPAGLFELRLFRNNSLEVIAVSEPFRVDKLSAKMEAASPSAVAGGSIRVRWRDLNFPHPKDWIGLFAVNGPAGSYSTKETGGAAGGELGLPLTNVLPGDYEIRMYSAGGWMQVAATPLRIVAHEHER